MSGLSAPFRLGAGDVSFTVRITRAGLGDTVVNIPWRVEALDGLGHELVVARSGEEALRLILQDDFAVILLDLHMPGMDGYETAALIRSRKRTRRTPIVFLTAIFRDEAHVFKAYSAGAVDVVFKPLDPFILRSKVSVLVDIYLRTEEAKRLAAHRQWQLFQST